MPMNQTKIVQEIFAKKNKANDSAAGSEKYQIKVIDDAKHSFAVRGDPKNKEELKQAQIAEDQAVEWFERWLLGKGT